MIVLLGDLHGSWHFFKGLEEVLTQDKRDNVPITIIQVGDFGFYPSYINSQWTGCKWPVYAIDGNHEYFPMISGLNKVTEIKNNLFYVPRGTVLELDGYRIGFLGGAESVDRAWRKNRVDWFEEERVTTEQANKLANEKLDILVTHAPPTNVILRNFGPINKREWNLPLDWEDKSAWVVEQLWLQLGQIPLFCGHMHRAVLDGNCRILDIDEPYFLPANDPNKKLELYLKEAILV